MLTSLPTSTAVTGLRQPCIPAAALACSVVGTSIVLHRIQCGSGCRPSMQAGEGITLYKSTQCVPCAAGYKCAGGQATSCEDTLLNTVLGAAECDACPTVNTTGGGRTGNSHCLDYSAAACCCHGRRHLHNWGALLPPGRRPLVRQQLLQRHRPGAAHRHQLLFGLPSGPLGRSAWPRRVPALVSHAFCRPAVLCAMLCCAVPCCALHYAGRMQRCCESLPHLRPTFSAPLLSPRLCHCDSPEGTYRRYGMVSTHCWSCPPGSFSAAGASSCTLCEPGTATAEPESGPDPATGGCPAWWVWPHSGACLSGKHCGVLVLENPLCCPTCFACMQKGVMHAYGCHAPCQCRLCSSA